MRDLPKKDTRRGHRVPSVSACLYSCCRRLRATPPPPPQPLCLLQVYKEDKYARTVYTSLRTHTRSLAYTQQARKREEGSARGAARGSTVCVPSIGLARLCWLLLLLLLSPTLARLHRYCSLPRARARSRAQQATFDALQLVCCV